MLHPFVIRYFGRLLYVVIWAGGWLACSCARWSSVGGVGRWSVPVPVAVGWRSSVGGVGLFLLAVIRWPVPVDDQTANRGRGLAVACAPIPANVLEYFGRLVCWPWAVGLCLFLWSSVGGWPVPVPVVIRGRSSVAGLEQEQGRAVIRWPVPTWAGWPLVIRGKVLEQIGRAVGRLCPWRAVGRLCPWRAVIRGAVGLCQQGGQKCSSTCSACAHVGRGA